MQATFQALLAPTDRHPTCTWPLNVVSQTRDLDVSQCFEHAVVLPVPSILAILIVLYRLLVIKRGLRNGKITWQHRPRDSRRLCTAKIVGHSTSNGSIADHVGYTMPRIASRLCSPFFVDTDSTDPSLIDSRLCTLSHYATIVHRPHVLQPLHLEEVVRSNPALLANLRPSRRCTRTDHDPHRRLIARYARLSGRQNSLGQRNLLVV